MGSIGKSKNFKGVLHIDSGTEIMSIWDVDIAAFIQFFSGRGIHEGVIKNIRAGPGEKLLREIIREQWSRNGQCSCDIRFEYWKSLGMHIGSPLILTCQSKNHVFPSPSLDDLLWLSGDQRGAKLIGDVANGEITKEKVMEEVVWEAFCGACIPIIELPHLYYNGILSLGDLPRNPSNIIGVFRHLDESHWNIALPLVRRGDMKVYTQDRVNPYKELCEVGCEAFKFFHENGGFKGCKEVIISSEWIRDPFLKDYIVAVGFPFVKTNAYYEMIYSYYLDSVDCVTEHLPLMYSIFSGTRWIREEDGSPIVIAEKPIPERRGLAIIAALVFLLHNVYNLDRNITDERFEKREEIAKDLTIRMTRIYLGRKFIGSNDEMRRVRHPLVRAIVALSDGMRSSFIRGTDPYIARSREAFLKRVRGAGVVRDIVEFERRVRSVPLWGGRV